ncbi:PaaI family thioesterase [Ovoidimarina sediminis]|uniref:PaaI family thioesterase n=1 Tax=Ovoidimarina sediminis TaxID=3079856 RepID=UPI0029063499|nr:PaaI family thioesterase [Rhodophyticola sp. MJ-SS7]MDU8945639.1 PaaI family thioesterase [Rhodophyticola sp. MJ-SS7]
MTPDALTAALHENFAPWVLDLGIEVTQAAPDHVITRMALTDRLARVGGIVSGQALAAMADTSMVLAASAARGVFTPFATTNLDTQFLRPGTGPAILCRAEIVRAGRAITFARATMTAEDSGKPVATATATLFAP